MTLTQCLTHWASSKPNEPLFISLEKEKELFTYKEILNLVHTKHNALEQYSKEETILLIYDETVDFITSFLACQSLGIIPIPMFFPKNNRHFDRMQTILRSSETKMVICSAKDEAKIDQGIKRICDGIKVVSLPRESNNLPVEYTSLETELNPIAFIQYTSGSTADPKGVIVTHKNLMHNQEMIREVFACDDDSVILSWLPFYHDMGLIGNLLHAIYVGGQCVIMKPSSVVSNPLKWLTSIQEYQVTHSGGPNFIYDLCNERISDEQVSSLDLSSWLVAYNGSEPIKTETIHKFQEKFSKANFSRDAYYCCYGLAEATLIVSGGRFTSNQTTVGSGRIVSEIDVIFYNEDEESFSMESGEICLKGESISSGYWRKDSSEYFVNYSDELYLRTGDKGTRSNDELIIQGRLKEMLILNGQNIFPYDLELIIANENTGVSSNGVALFENENELFVAAELNRDQIGLPEVVYQELKQNICKLLIDSVGKEPQEVFFVVQRSLPRTSSGKIKRTQIYSIWKQDKLRLVVDLSEEKNPETNKFDLSNFKWDQENVSEYLIHLLKNKLKLAEDTDYQNTTLMELGLSSLKAVEVVNQINSDLEIQIEFEKVFELNRMEMIVEYILDLKWLSSNIDGEEEIIL